MGRVNSAVIKTPEGVIFTLLPAGPAVRFVAWAIDLACVFVILIPLNAALRFVSLLNADTAQALAIACYFLVSVGYAMVSEWRFKGQTVGKHLLSIRVMDEEGKRLRPSQIIVRNLLRIVDSLPLCYMVGGLFCLLTRRSQRLGDMAGATLVIREPKIGRPDLEQIASHKYNSLREHPLVAARLRQRSSAWEADLALQACLRREEFDPSARVQLFSDIAAHFRRLADLPSEVVDRIGGEQLVRDVVDLLFAADCQYREMSFRDTEPNDGRTNKASL